MNRFGKGVSLLVLFSSAGCRFDFEVRPDEDGDGTNSPTDAQSFAGANSASGGSDSAPPPAVGGSDDNMGGAAPSGGTMGGELPLGGASAGGASTGGADTGGTSTGGADPDPPASGGGDGTGGSAPTCTPLSGCDCATLDTKTYQFCSTNADFAGAVFQCGLGLLGLLEIESSEENDFVKMQANAAGLFDGAQAPYTSGSDLLGEGNWTWQSLTVFWANDAAQVPFTNWDAPPTIDTANNCLLLRSFGTWIEGSCDTPRPFICESL